MSRADPQLVPHSSGVKALCHQSVSWRLYVLNHHFPHPRDRNATSYLPTVWKYFNTQGRRDWGLPSLVITMWVTFQLGWSSLHEQELILWVARRGVSNYQGLCKFEAPVKVVIDPSLKAHAALVVLEVPLEWRLGQSPQFYTWTPWRHMALGRSIIKVRTFPIRLMNFEISTSR